VQAVDGEKPSDGESQQQWSDLQICIVSSFVKEVCLVRPDDRISDPDENILQLSNINAVQFMILQVTGLLLLGVTDADCLGKFIQCNCEGKCLWTANHLCVNIEESTISLDVQKPILLVRLFISLTSTSRLS